ncbi:prostasin-like [Paroedura picta]|uniref:prostasin-like n=1 Tax=Paroedura picta TaxID=143630 RepID=UPI004057549D
MSNGAQASQLSPDTMAQEMIEGYQKSPGHEVLLDEESLQVEVYNGLCLLKPSSPQLPNWASDSNRKGDKKGFPWHVTVLKDGDPACTGSLVTEKWVLSTSNCVASGNDSSVYSVQLGAMDKHADGSERYPIAKIIRSSSTVQDNLVLIQLARPPPITPLVHPICLPDWTQVAPVGTKCNSLGSKKNDKPNVMEWTVTSSLGCNLPSSPTSLCAQTEDLKKDTQMTAGGSFVCPGENEQLYLEGIIPSTIKSKEKSQLKQQLVVFTRVAPRVQWIESQVRP